MLCQVMPCVITTEFPVTVVTAQLAEKAKYTDCISGYDTKPSNNEAPVR